MPPKPREDDTAFYRREARFMRNRTDIAVALIEAALVTYGSSRHPLIDTLLDVRNALRNQ